MQVSILCSDIDPPFLVEFGNDLDKIKKRRRDRYRVFLYLKQGMKCHYCREKMLLAKISNGNFQPPNLATFEHLVDDWATEHGKDNSLDKVVLACRKCNHSRNNLRQNIAINFYRTKFASIKEFKEFSIRKSPTDFIKTFGPVPEFLWKQSSIKINKDQNE